MLSLCWLAFKVTCVSSTLKKLTEITFLFALCQIKSHFFLIPFLICFDLSYSSGLTAISRGELVYNNTSQKTCQAIFSTFLKIFGNFFEKLIFACCFRDSLYIIPLYFYIVNSFLLLFWNFFNFFQRNTLRLFLDFTRARMIQYII